MSGRTLGLLPISVGTSLAFETLMASAGEPIEALYFNLRTLFRNAYQAYETDDRDKITPAQLYEDVIRDLQEIDRVKGQLGANPNPEILIYYPSYKGLSRRFKHARVWEPTTDLQKKYAALEARVCGDIAKALKNHVKETDVALPMTTKKTYLLTHYPVDLVVKSGFGEIKLLESHTGAVKSKKLWYTKLTNGKNLENIPFNSLTLQVFGDNSTSFKAMSLKMKQLLTKLAKDNNWSSLTTNDRVRFCLPQITDHPVRTMFSDMLRD